MQDIMYYTEVKKFEKKDTISFSLSPILKNVLGS